MADTLSISLEGMRNAELRLERAARNIADGQSRPAELPRDTDSVRLSSQAPTLLPLAPDSTDYAREAVTIIEARIGLEANRKTGSAQTKLDRATLDLIG